MPGQLRTKPLSIAAVGMTLACREITDQAVYANEESYRPPNNRTRIT
ncbi:phage capsid protein, partial [Pseudoalteromonas sp. S979]